MAYERYNANVQALCDQLRIPNPIQDDNLLIKRIRFCTLLAGKDRESFFDVEETEWNRAGRLFIQSLGEESVIEITQVLKEKAAAFFTDEMWNDCSIKKRTLIFGLKTADYLEINREDISDG